MTIQKTLHADNKRYKILKACNPKSRFTPEELKQANLKEICQVLHKQFKPDELAKIYEETIFGIINQHTSFNLTNFMKEWFKDDLVDEPYDYREDLG